MAAEQETKEVSGYGGVRPKEISSGSAGEVYARLAYPDISRGAGCKVYYETECGMKNCCFECIRRFVCKEFEGGCDRYTRATYKECPQIIQEAE